MPILRKFLDPEMANYCAILIDKFSHFVVIKCFKNTHEYEIIMMPVEKIL